VRAVNAAALFHEILAKAAQGSDGGATSHPPTHTASDKPAPAP
jgi:hypothetical protein